MYTLNSYYSHASSLVSLSPLLVPFPPHWAVFPYTFIFTLRPNGLNQEQCAYYCRFASLSWDLVVSPVVTQLVAMSWGLVALPVVTQLVAMISLSRKLSVARVRSWCNMGERNLNLSHRLLTVPLVYSLGWDTVALGSWLKWLCHAKKMAFLGFSSIFWQLGQTWVSPLLTFYYKQRVLWLRLKVAFICRYKHKRL